MGIENPTPHQSRELSASYERLARKLERVFRENMYTPDMCMLDRYQYHLVFLYHDCSSITMLDCIGEAHTLQEYELYESQDIDPVLIEQDESSNPLASVVGKLYLASTSALRELDRWACNGCLYIRKRELVCLVGHPNMRLYQDAKQKAYNAWLYKGNLTGFWDKHISNANVERIPEYYSAYSRKPYVQSTRT